MKRFNPSSHQPERALQAWVILEALLAWQRARGVAPAPLPPLGAEATAQD
mgnify:CR=1 FL=1